VTPFAGLSEDRPPSGDTRDASFGPYPPPGGASQVIQEVWIWK
jgi:hypothetical protein